MVQSSRDRELAVQRVMELLKYHYSLDEITVASCWNDIVLLDNRYIVDPPRVRVIVGRVPGSGIVLGDYTLETRNVNEWDVPLWLQVFNLLRLVL